MSIALNVALIREEIKKAALSAGRDPESVALVAVSKTKPIEMVTEAINAGQRIFGENYVQELVEKSELESVAEWHFIGHLQTNKVKLLAGRTSLIHSVDRVSLAQEINRQWGKIGRKAEILIQVNIAQELTKSGVSSDEAAELVKYAASLENIVVKGLMIIPPYSDDPEDVRPYFRELKMLSEKIESMRLPNVSMNELSMGMSGDFRVAIQEGATLVRIGTAIFGSR